MTTTATPPHLAPPYRGQRLVRRAGHLVVLIGADHLVAARRAEAPVARA